MSKVLRYVFLFDSEFHGYKIEHYQEGFSGTSQFRRLGAAPVFVRDKAENGIMGTSIELSIEADLNNELVDFYTTDSKKHLFKLYIDETLKWQGYALPERYSESYVAPPYDVEVTAADGLGILKSVDFDLTGQYSISQIIKYILDKTQLYLDFEFLFNISVSGQGNGMCTLSQTKVWAQTWAEMTCYDALSAIMVDIHAFVTQKDGRWLIARYSDLLSLSWIYSNDLTTILNSRYLPVVDLGSELEARPIGSLSLDINPAKKSCLFTFPYIQKPSFLNNYNFYSDLSFWDYNEATRFIYNEVAYARLDGILSLQLGGVFKYIQQSITVNQGTQIYELIFKYIIGQNLGGPTSQGKLKVRITLVSGSKTYYYSENGWSTSSHSYTIQETTQSITHTSVAASSFSVKLNGIPAAGTLTIKFSYETEEMLTLALITDVMFHVYTSAGLQIKSLLAESASETADDVQIDVQDNPFTENASRILYNNFENVDDSAFSKTWIENSTEKSDTYINTIVRDYISHIAYPSKVLKGKIESRLIYELLFKDVFSDTIYYVSQGTYDMLEEEADCELYEYMPYDDTISVSPASVLQENSSRSSSGSSSGSSSQTTSITDSALGSAIVSFAEKVLPADADMFALMDSADSNKAKKFSWGNLKAKMRLYLEYVFAAYNHTHDNYASLVNGLVPASQLPSFVDDIIDAYIVGSTPLASNWLSETDGGSSLTPEGGKIYIVISAGNYYTKQFRWTGSTYAQTGGDLALGESETTAFRGDHGKAAYDHSQTASKHVTTTEKSLLENATSNATADTLMKRDPNGKMAVTAIIINGIELTIE